MQQAMEGARLRFVLALVALAAASGWLHDAGGHALAGAPPNFSGVYDALIDDFDPAQGLFHCMIRVEHNGVSNAISAPSECYPDTDLADPHAEPREALPGEGPDGLPGLPPPPPYNWQAPAVGTGVYDPTSPGAESFLVTTCFRELGGSLGPNALATATVYLPEEQLAAFGFMVGQVVIYPRQGSAQCQTNVPEGQPMQPWEIDLYPVDDVNGGGPNSPAPWRTLGDHDFDDDGCSDADELSGVAACGDDPYSSLDLATAGTDVSGNYMLVATVEEADVCWNGGYGVPATPCGSGDGSLVPGVYHTCLLDVQQGGMALSARTYCYIDSTSIAVNPQVAIPAGSKTCPPAAAEYCGDGLVGAAPPGRTVDPSGQINFGDIDDRHAVLTGQLQNGRIGLSGCLEDRDGKAALGHVYLVLDVDAHTGQGDITIHTVQTQQACTAGTPSGTPAPVAVSLVRQATAAQQRDTDGDGCADRQELSDTRQQGGLRDPFNHYDYFNPTGDGMDRIDDVLAVVNEYFLDDPPGNIDYFSLTDRTGITGANDWNVGPPNGQQRVDDILFIVKQYFNDC
jgi:hypothetical protein